VRQEQPHELDLRASLSAALLRSGAGQLEKGDLHGRLREPVAGRALLLLIDASGSHAQHNRMEAVKGAALGLLGTLSSSDTVGVIAFRGAQAELICPPSRDLAAARRALDYLPTGGRTPLAHALQLTAQLLGELNLSQGGTVALFTDGRANVPTQTEDAWQDALTAAAALRATAPTLQLHVIDTEQGPRLLGRAKLLADALHATFTTLEIQP
jgi:magnesium chelatase subunit D